MGPVTRRRCSHSTRRGRDQKRRRLIELDRRHAALCVASVREADHQGNNPYQNEADGPGCVQVEPASRHEFETEVAVNQPRRASAGRDHRGGMHNGHQHGHAEIGIDEPGCRLVACVEVRGLAQPEIDRHEHQSSAMSDRYREGPEP